MEPWDSTVGSIVSQSSTDSWNENGTSTPPVFLITVDPVHIILYLAIGATGISGNLFALLILCSSSALRRKPFNMILISQSMLDLANATVLIATAWDVVYGYKPGHNGFLVFHKTKFGRKQALGMILVAWLIGPSFNLARYIPTTTITLEGICLWNQIWPNTFWHSVTNLVVYLLSFVFPVLIIVSLYISIFISLRRRAVSTSLGEISVEQSNIMHKAKVNVLKTLFILSGLFFICWVGNVTFLFISSFVSGFSFTSPFYNFTVFMLCINCCVNPFCYAAQYKDFQAQAKNMFCRWRISRDQDHSVESVYTVQSSTT